MLGSSGGGVIGTRIIVNSIQLNILSCVKYVPEPEDATLLSTALKVYRQFKRYPQALRLALMLNDLELAKEIFLECPNEYVCVCHISNTIINGSTFDISLLRKQLAFMLGRQQIFLTLDDKDCPNSEDLSDIMSNVHLNTNFLALGREVGVAI